MRGGGCPELARGGSPVRWVFWIIREGRALSQQARNMCSASRVERWRVGPDRRHLSGSGESVQMCKGSRTCAESRECARLRTCANVQGFGNVQGIRCANV